LKRFNEIITTTAVSSAETHSSTWWDAQHKTCQIAVTYHYKSVAIVPF